MHCPACGAALQPMQVGALAVDTCSDGCGGVWFDHRELRRVDEAAEPAEPLLRLEGDLDPPDPSRRYNCPKCSATVMMRHYSSILHRVTVDECPECGGYWLDEGELAAIRAEFPTEEARRQAAEDVAAQHALELEKTSEKTRQWAGIIGAVARLLGRAK